uniref:Putative secreted peptide n=1 Tax=Anopheles braziliensis TaxID=58242 RepID=A0A2M3ZPV4_9DIPT
MECARWMMESLAAVVAAVVADVAGGGGCDRCAGAPLAYRTPRDKNSNSTTQRHKPPNTNRGCLPSLPKNT